MVQYPYVYQSLTPVRAIADPVPRTPLIAATENAFSVINHGLKDFMDTIRIFMDCTDFADAGGDGWKSLGHLADHSSGHLGARVDYEAMEALLLWMLGLSSSEIRANFIEAEYANLLFYVIHGRAQNALGLLLALGPGKAIDTPMEKGRSCPAGITTANGYSLLMTNAVYRDSALSDIISQRPNLHVLGLDLRYSPDLETPTSLAMYSAWAFAHWQITLGSLEVDIKQFALCEMEQSPLVKRGWDRMALQILFDWDFEPDFHLEWGTGTCCGDCSKKYFSPRVQPSWLYLLDKIIRREYLHNRRRSKPKSHQYPNENNTNLLRAQEATGPSVGVTSVHDFDTDRGPASPPSDQTSKDRKTEEPGDEYSAAHTNDGSCDCQENDLCIHCWLNYLWDGLAGQYPSDGISDEHGAREETTISETASNPGASSGEDFFSSNHLSTAEETKGLINDSFEEQVDELDCLYRRSDIVCMDCWLYHQKTGFRRTPSAAEPDSSDTDDSSESDYSPFLFPS